VINLDGDQVQVKPVSSVKLGPAYDKIKTGANKKIEPPAL